MEEERRHLFRDNGLGRERKLNPENNRCTSQGGREKKEEIPKAGGKKNPKLRHERNARQNLSAGRRGPERPLAKNATPKTEIQENRKGKSGGS